MATKPQKPAWIPSDDTNVITAPTTPKRNSGWASEEAPPFQFFNWFWNLVSKWMDFIGGVAEYNVIISSDADEQDYPTMAAYIADSPAIGDRILMKTDEVLTATLVIPAGVRLKQIKGKKFTLTANFSPIIQFGNDAETEGTLRIENSNTGTIAKGVSFSGDNNKHDNIILDNKNTGTITNGFILEAGKKGILAKGQTFNAGGGTITTILSDVPEILSNDVQIRETV